MDDRWHVILHDPEHCGHRVEKMVRLLALQEFYDNTTNTPGFQSASKKSRIPQCFKSYQISDAVVAPDCSITSGATLVGKHLAGEMYKYHLLQ